MERMVNAGNADIVLAVIEAIRQNSAYLSEIDGATGDGDHGANMNKGFTLAAERIDANASLSEALETLGTALVMDIGGSMGPIYGTILSELSRAFAVEKIGVEDVIVGLSSAAEQLKDLAGAREGDKTLLDTIMPALRATTEAKERGDSFSTCLDALQSGAAKGMESTRGMVAKIGRASRLGERSRGFLDAGATSCCIILTSLARGMRDKIR